METKHIDSFQRSINKETRAIVNKKVSQSANKKLSQY